MYEKGDLVFHIHHLKDFGPGIVLGIRDYEHQKIAAYVVYFSTIAAILNTLEKDLVQNVPAQVAI